MSRFLSRMSLKFQIGLIGVVGVLGILVFALIYFTSAAEEQRIRRLADQASAANERLLELENALLQARRAEKDFLLRLDETYVDRHRGRVEEALALVDSLKAVVVAPDDSATLDRVAEGIAAYGRQFVSLADHQRALGLDESSGLMGEIRAAATGIEKALSDVNNAVLKIGLLNMRRGESDFFAGLDPKYVYEMKAAAAKFSANVKMAGISEKAKAEIPGKLDDYLAKFLAASDMALGVANETKALSESYAALVPDFQAIDESVTAAHAQASGDIAAIEAATSARLAWSIAIVTLMVCALATMIALMISRPLIGMTQTMSALAAGRRDVEIEGTGRRDEIGSMAKALLVFKENAAAMEKLRVEQVAAEERAAVEKKATMKKLADDFESSVGAIVQLVVQDAGEMRATAQSMTETAKGAGDQSAVVAAASTQTSSNVQMVAAATEELASSVSEIGRQVSQSAEIAGNAVAEASKANTTIQSLSEAAKLINNVVQLINDIAGQTNLLALNATIEAARAGEAGKGFAVVASEVKNLATQTAKATEEIASQVTNMQNATGQAVGAIEAIGTTINRISDNAVAISAAVEEQGAATQEIAKNVQQAAIGTEQVSQGITKVTHAAAETGDAANRVLSASTEMEQQGRKLHDEVGAFLNAIRAG